MAGLQRVLGDLGVWNPDDYHQLLGIWTLRFIAITLALTPLRWITGFNPLALFRRMVGLFAFFYGSLHFMTYFILDHSLQFSGVWDDVVKRPYITAGFTAFVLMIPLAFTSTQGWNPPARWEALEPAASAHLPHRHGRRAPLFLEGEARHHVSDLLRDAGGRAVRRAGLAAPRACGRLPRPASFPSAARPEVGTSACSRRAPSVPGRARPDRGLRRNRAAGLRVALVEDTLGAEPAPATRAWLDAGVS